MSDSEDDELVQSQYPYKPYLYDHQHRHSKPKFTAEKLDKSIAGKLELINQLHDVSNKDLEEIAEEIKQIEAKRKNLYLDPVVDPERGPSKVRFPDGTKLGGKKRTRRNKRSKGTRRNKRSKGSTRNRR